MAAAEVGDAFLLPGFRFEVKYPPQPGAKRPGFARSLGLIGQGAPFPGIFQIRFARVLEQGCFRERLRFLGKLPVMRRAFFRRIAIDIVRCPA